MCADAVETCCTATQPCKSELASKTSVREDRRQPAIHRSGAAPGANLSPPLFTTAIAQATFAARHIRSTHSSASVGDCLPACVLERFLTSEHTTTSASSFGWACCSRVSTPFVELRRSLVNPAGTPPETARTLGLQAATPTNACTRADQLSDASLGPLLCSHVNIWLACAVFQSFECSTLSCSRATKRSMQASPGMADCGVPYTAHAST